METKRSAVAAEVAVEVVSQKASELIRSLDVGTGRDEMTTGQSLVEVGIVTAIQLVDDHLPDGVTPGRAVLGIAVAFMGHPVVKGVRPDGHATEGSGDGSVVHEELVGHHLKLLVAADAEVGSADANDGSVGDVSESLNDETVTGHLSQPVVIRALSPVFGIISVGDGEDADLVTATVEFLDC